MNEEKPDIEELFRQGTPIDEALREAVRDAFREHKRLGQPIIVCEDGKVVEIAPEDIPVDFED